MNDVSHIMRKRKKSNDFFVCLLPLKTENYIDDDIQGDFEQTNRKKWTLNKTCRMIMKFEIFFG